MSKLIAAVVLLMAVAGAVWAESEQARYSTANRKTYETAFTPAARQAYDEDINVWVYTQEFAERFGMPEKWIDNDLKGALALAYRVETAPIRLMFPHKGPNVSMPIRRCILDVYLAFDAPLPWGDDVPTRSRYYPPDSAGYLIPQEEADRIWLHRPLGFQRPVQARRPLIYFGRPQDPIERSGTGHLRGYDRLVYPGVTKLALGLGCFRKGGTALWIQFLRDGPWHGKRNMMDYVIHRIDIPASFMERVHARYGETDRERVQRWKGVLGR